MNDADWSDSSTAVSKRFQALLNAPDLCAQLRLIGELPPGEPEAIVAVATFIMQAHRMYGRLSDAHSAGALRRRFAPAIQEAAERILRDSQHSETVARFGSMADQLAERYRHQLPSGRHYVEHYAVAISNKARSERGTQPWGQVEPLYLLSIGLWRCIDDLFNEAVVWNNLAQAYLHRSQVNESVALSKHAESLAIKVISAGHGELSPMQMLTALMKEGDAQRLATACRSNNAAALILSGQSREAIEPLLAGCAFWESIDDEKHLRVDRVNLLKAYHYTRRFTERDRVLRQILGTEDSEEPGAQSVAATITENVVGDKELVEAIAISDLFPKNSTSPYGQLEQIMSLHGSANQNVQEFAENLLDKVGLTGQLDLTDKEISFAGLVASVLVQTSSHKRIEALNFLNEALTKQLNARPHPASRENFIVQQREQIDRLIQGWIDVGNLNRLYEALETFAGRPLTDLCLRVDPGPWPPPNPASFDALAASGELESGIVFVRIIPLQRELRILLIWAENGVAALELLEPVKIGWVELHDLLWGMSDSVRDLFDAHAKYQVFGRLRGTEDKSLALSEGFFWVGSEDEHALFEQRVKEGAVSQGELWGGLLSAMNGFIQDGADRTSGLHTSIALRDLVLAFPSATNALVLEATRIVDRSWSQLAAQLADALVAPLMTRLRGTKTRELVFLAPGRFGQIPFSGLPTSKGSDRDCLLDHFQIAAVPSIAVWLHLRGRRKKGVSKRPSMLAVTDPTEDLSFAALEGEMIREVCRDTTDVSGLIGKEATLGAVDWNVKGKTYIAFACHAGLSASPNRHSLYLAQGDRLLLSDLQWAFDLSGCELVVLSACDSSRSYERLESLSQLGLADACLAAGALGAVGSVWPVRDIESLLLVAELWRLVIVEKYSPQEGLRRAQLNLRQMSATDAGALFEHASRNSHLSSASRERARMMAVRFASGNPTDRPFASPLSWAGMRYRGA